MVHLASENKALLKPQVMGVLNITPDSFYDAGCWLDREKSLQHAAKMVNEGATIIDIGGESSRPGATPVSLAEELDRVIPVIECLAKEFDVILSIDTYKPEVMLQAINAGARMVNDIKALQTNGAMDIISQTGVKVCLMHMQGQPQTMQHNINYAQDIVVEIRDFFAERMRQCLAAGINKHNIIIDPGFGFGKTTAHNMRLINQLQNFKSLGVDILLGVSHKASIGEILQVSVDERLIGSVALATLGVYNGAQYIRAHDVKATVQAITMACAVRTEYC